MWCSGLADTKCPADSHGVSDDDVTVMCCSGLADTKCPADSHSLSDDDVTVMCCSGLADTKCPADSHSVSASSGVGDAGGPDSGAAIPQGHGSAALWRQLQRSLELL